MKTKKYRWFCQFFLIGFIFCEPAYPQSQDSLKFIGIVEKSDNHKVDDVFDFTLLNTNHPLVLYPSGYEYKMAKVFEDN